MQSILALFLTVRGEDIDIRPFNPISPLILLALLFVLRKRGKSAGYLVCFSLFFFYLWTVFAYAVCPIPIGSGLVAWLGQTQTWQNHVNLIPGAFLKAHRFWTEIDFYGNVLLGAPFGFGLPFVVGRSNVRAARVIPLGFAFAAGLELIQLGLSLIFYGFPYRSIDIDDVLLVFGGTLAGYGLLRGAAYLYRRLSWVGGARLPVWGHIHDVLLSLSKARSIRFVSAPKESLQSRQIKRKPCRGR